MLQEKPLSDEKKCDHDYDGSSSYGHGIKDSILTVNNIALAYVIYSDKSNAQSNAATLIAGDDIKSCVENELDLEKDEKKKKW
ncbi:MAG: hypothetical protein HPY74_09495 [Firmicutes bacterium]|nr:hypothetical protein [Bacillota bacterium]